MTDKLFLEATDDTPSVILDSENQIFEISNRSLPEDPTNFYSPVFKWLENYSLHPNAITEFHFKMEYFNTASAKQILKILVLLENLSAKSNLTVHWHFEKADSDMKTSGERYSKLVKINFEFIED